MQRPEAAARGEAHGNMTRNRRDAGLREMSVLRNGLVFLLALLAALPAAARDPRGDAGEPGFLVYSVGTIKIGMHFAFHYRNTAATGERPTLEGRIEPKLGGALYLKVKHPDFAGEETGHVVIRSLPAGHYEVHRFAFGGFVPGAGTTAWSPTRPFSLPFQIRSGEATYIGSFMRAPSLGTPLESSLGAAGFFVIADRADRDLPIAGPRMPAGIRVTREVTDVDAFGGPILRTRHP